MTVDTKPDVTFADNVTKFVLAGGVLILLVAAVGIGFGAIRARGANQATRQWLDYVRAEDYAGAHAMLAGDRRRQIDVDRFRAAVSANVDLRGYRRFRGETVDNEHGVLVVTGRIMSDSGERKAEFRWLRESGSDGTRLTLENVSVVGSSALFAEEAP